MCIYIYVCIYMYAYIHIYIYTFIYMYKYMYVYIYIYAHVYIHIIHMSIYIHQHMCICTYMNIEYMYIHTYMCVYQHEYVYVHTRTGIRTAVGRSSACPTKTCRQHFFPRPSRYTTQYTGGYSSIRGCVCVYRDNGVEVNVRFVVHARPRPLTGNTSFNYPLGKPQNVQMDISRCRCWVLYTLKR